MFKNSILLICFVYIVFFAVHFLLAYLNVHNLIFLSMVHEYAYKTYEDISKLANWATLLMLLRGKTDSGGYRSAFWVSSGMT